MNSLTQEIYDTIKSSLDTTPELTKRKVLEVNFANVSKLRFFAWGDEKKWQSGYLEVKKNYPYVNIARALVELKKIIPNLSFDIPDCLLITDEIRDMAKERFLENT